VHDTTTFLLVTLSNIHRFEKKITGRFSNETFLMQLLTKPPSYTTMQFIVNHLLSGINVSQGGWQHIQGVVGFLIMLYCKFTTESDSERILKIG